jgi:hypothetical protein
MSARPVVNLAYAIPAGSRKATRWRDGFTAAIELLGSRFDVRWLNIHPTAPDQDSSLERLPDCDVLLVNSNWRWIVDRLVRRRLGRSRPPLALKIAGVGDPPRRRPMRFYDVLFYETPWYEPRIARHPRRIHAFGVDTRVMRPQPGIERDVDWLSVGALKPYKRHDLVTERPGRRVVIGDRVGADAATVSALERNGVELHDFGSYEELAGWYRRSRNVLVGATTEGGGERALFEARACGAQVHTPGDNPKLEQLRDAPLWDHHYFASRLAEGIGELAGT